MPQSSVEKKFIALNRLLLDAIQAQDWEKYEHLVDPSVTCFEPESVGHLVEGLSFHEYYFKIPRKDADSKSKVLPPPDQPSMVRPHVRVLGETAAVVSYVRLTQCLDQDGKPKTTMCEETRVWQKCEGLWKNVHLHRSTLK